MADQKISQLTALTSIDSADSIPVVDSSASETKRITKSDLFGSRITKWISGDLAAVDTPGGVFAVANPESSAIIVTGVFIDVTTASTGSCGLSVGVTNDATTLDSTLIARQQANTIRVIDSLGSKGDGTFSSQKANAGQYITCSAESGTSVGLAGKYYISYIVV